MKTLIVHKNGKILFTMEGANISKDYKCMVVDIEEGKELVSVDVENNTVITKEKDTRVEDVKTYLDNTDETTVANVEATILETEKNKVIENGGM